MLTVWEDTRDPQEMKGQGSKEILIQEGGFDPQDIGGLREMTDTGVEDGCGWKFLTYFLKQKILVFQHLLDMLMENETHNSYSIVLFLLSTQ